MTRLVALLGAVLLVLTVGLFGLGEVFVEERSDAMSAVRAEREALQAYAREVLRGKLSSSFEASRERREEALDDPLVPSEDLLWIDKDGAQELPRRVEFRPTDDLGPQLEGDTDSPWLERIDLLRSIELAVESKDRKRIEELVRKALEHRVRYVIHPQLDVSSTLSMLETLWAKSDVDPVLLRLVLRDGLVDREHGKMLGLMRSLLLNRNTLSQQEFRVFSDRTVDLARKAGLVTEDFEREARRPVGSSLEVPAIDRLSLVRVPSAMAGESRYFVIGREDGNTVGAAVDVEEMMRGLERTLFSMDRITRSVVLTQTATVVPIEALEVSVQSSSWGTRELAAEQRFRWKIGLLVLCFGLAITLVIAGGGLVRREKRWVELKSEFVSTVSHELRTPLASIRLLAETLERRVAEVPKAKDYPTRIVREVDGLSHMVENILSFSRLSQGGWLARSETVELSDVVQRLREDFRLATKPVQIDCELEISAINADPELLMLALSNLCKNAIVHNRNDSVCIQIKSLRRDREVVLEVSDNGVGIEERDWNRVFAEFERLPTQKTRGTGLGLSIVRRALRAHGGEAKITHSSPAGTTFALVFPVAVES